MARSAAALVQGFEGFDAPRCPLPVCCSTIWAATAIWAYLKEAMGGHVRMPVLGGLMRDEKPLPSPSGIWGW
jgi:cobyrinic acid a,c-diamide synthase